MGKLKEYLRCVWFLHKHKKEPENRQKRRRRSRDKHIDGKCMRRLLAELQVKER